MNRSLLILLSCSALACAKPDDQSAPKTEAQPASDAAEAPPPAPRAEGGEQAVAEAKQNPEPIAEIEPASEPAAEAKPDSEAIAEVEAPLAEPGVVPVTTVTPTKVNGAWRQAASPSERLTFVNLTGGVLASSASGYYDLDDSGQLILRAEIEAPPAYADLIGVWPSNVWYIERRDGKPWDDRGGEPDELRLMRLRNGKRWVPQEYGGDQRFEDEGQRFLEGAKGGLLVWADYSITRVAGGSDDPESGMYKGRDLMSFAETRSGRLYTISDGGDVYYVQRDCADQQCVDENAKQLPFGDAWEFSKQVPRQRHSVSMIAIVDHEGTHKNHLLHYEAGGWKLESVSSAPTGLWPTKDGGLWAQLGTELWHRDPDGGWRNVGLPEGAGSVSVAIREDQSELWIAAMVADKPVVFATHANAQEPPPTTPEIAPQAG